MNPISTELLDTVRGLCRGEGASPTDTPGLTAWRFTGRRIRMPQSESPYLYVVLDGMLRLYTPSGVLDYPAGQYSISQVDTPLSGTVLTQSARGGDFLALSLTFTVYDVISTVLALDNDLVGRILGDGLGEAAHSASDTAAIRAVFRLLPAMQQAVPSEFLRRNIMQEIIYSLLCGSCGRQLIQSAANVDPADEIYAANSWIKENFRSSFTVEELAGQRHMSVSQFHQKFKSAVGMGPLQCQKRLRLTEARRLMLDEGSNVTEASAEVGYESLSQFIRDYRKMFGAAPKEDVRSIRSRRKE